MSFRKSLILFRIVDRKLMANLLLFVSAVAAIFIYVFDLKANAQGLNFTFPFFDSNDHNIQYKGAASVSEGEIQLTRNSVDQSLQRSFGGASYLTQIPLWDSHSPSVATFTTTFRFHINSSNGGLGYGDGIAFFMSAAASHLPLNSSGGWLGLTLESHNGDASNKFVAVEFDTFKNPWDPDSNHVGIDVNSVTSEAVVVASELNQILGNDPIATESSSLKNRTLSARIDYDGQMKKLLVFLSNNTEIQSGNWPDPILSHDIDLSGFLPEKIVVGFSSTTGEVTGTDTLLSWNFSSTSHRSKQKQSKSKLAAKYVAIIIVVSVTALAVCAYSINRWHMKRKSTSSEPDHVGTDGEEMDEFFAHGPRKFTYADLSAATNNFSEKEKLGEGGFGGVYRGLLSPTNEIVAVKRVSPESKQGKKEYVSEVTIISRLRHRNLVQLLGWCHQRAEFLLVYEYMPNGSLDRHLFGKEEGALLLSWSRRYNIACGLASALLYLHQEWDQRVLHRDVKSSNVMLDSNFNAKLGDFGLARLVEHDRVDQTTVVIAGTWGYLAPECLMTSKYSPESDVFGFGAVALEIACGRRVVDNQFKEHNMRLVDRVWDFYGQGRVFECADPRLNAEFDREQMERLMVVGLWCSHPHPDGRPAIKQALKVLQFEAPLPSGLPTKMPVPTYCPRPHPDASSSSSSLAGLSSYSQMAVTPRP